VTDSIQALLDTSARRRGRQSEYNAAHGITPQGVKRALQQSLQTYEKELAQAEQLNSSLVADDVTTYDKLRVIAELEEEMREASSRLEFERAAHLRDQIAALKQPAAGQPAKPVTYPAGKSRRTKRVSS
jgi:excinuclease ABC subunit B